MLTLAPFFLFLVSSHFSLRLARWFPIEKLQLEQSLSLGKADPPAIVAERARIVFTTLQMVAPQFPKR